MTHSTGAVQLSIQTITGMVLQCFWARQTALDLPAKGLHGTQHGMAMLPGAAGSIDTCQIVFLPFNVPIMCDRLPKAHHVLFLQSQLQNLSGGHNSA